jgi:hypothetical protein
MEDITRDPDDPDDPDAWMWSFDDEDASRDATKKVRQNVFTFYLIPRFFVDNAFLLKRASNTPALTKLPAPLPHVASASSSVSPSPFAAPSRASTSNPREETVHTATLNTADMGNHAPLSRDDKSLAPPGENASGDIEMRSVGPDHDRDQGPVEVCTITPASPARIHTPCNRISLLPRTAPPTASSTRTQYRCLRPYASFCVYAYAM